MTITARYPSQCAACKRPIRPGDKIEWERGAKAVHTVCVATTSADKLAATSPPERKRSARPNPRPTWREPKDGEREVARRHRGGRDGYQPGEVVHALKVDGGGGPDGHYYVVTHAWSSRANEDNGQYDDQAHAYLRAATDDECAPIIASERRTHARKTCESLLAGALKWDAPGVSVVSDTGQLPPAAERLAEVTIGRTVTSSGTMTDGGTTYVVTATSIVAHHGGYYDDYRSSTRTRAGTELLARLVVALRDGAIDDLAVLADSEPSS